VLLGGLTTLGRAASPAPGSILQSAVPVPEPSTDAGLRGSVVDGNGAFLPGARVMLLKKGATEGLVTESDDTGQFTFGQIPPGVFTVTITFPGFKTFASPDLILRAGEKQILPKVSLSVYETFEVNVVASPDEVAQAQVGLLEKQRVFGIFPNFYTSYFSHPAPLSTAQKYHLALHAILDPGTFLSAGAVAGIEQAQNIFPGYGQGAQGYAKRFGAASADSAISRMLGSAVLPGILHQDPRYFYKGSGTIRSRIVYALGMTVICKADDGRYQANYSHIGGSLASGAIANLYHARQDRGFGLTMMQFLLDFTGRASNNLIQEFLLRRVTTNAPSQDGKK
jgi:hypothetical protein